MNTKDPEVILPNGQREIASHYYPLIGPYSSKDPKVLEYHFLLMKAAGITGIIIDWYGAKGTNGDIDSLLTNSNAIIEALEQHNLKFAIMMEDQFAGSIEDSKDNVAYVKDNYFNRANYARDEEGKPFLMVFGPQTFETEAEWNEILFNTGEPVTFLTLNYQSADAGTAASGEFSWVYQKKDEICVYANQNSIKNFYTNKAPTLDHTGGSVYPGFHDFYAEGYGNPNKTLFYIDYENGGVFNNLIEMAKEHQDEIDFLQVVTWNDWGEGTMIEPSVERQFDSLVALASLTNGSTDVALYQSILDLHALLTNNGDVTEIENLRNQIDAAVNA